MPSTSKTPYHGLNQWTATDKPKRTDFNADNSILDAALSPTMNQSTAPTSATQRGTVAAAIGWLANRIRAITGKSNWHENPAVTLEQCNTHINDGIHTAATTSKAGIMSVADKTKLDCIWYGTCSTAAATAGKTVDCAGYTRYTGAKVAVKFTVTNTASNPHLTVNNTGAYYIYHMGTYIPAGFLKANEVYEFVFTGSYYELINSPHIHDAVTQSTNGFMTASDKTKLDNAVSTGTASRMMIRDTSGRAQVADPSAAADIANKNYVDNTKVNRTSGEFDTGFGMRNFTTTNTWYENLALYNGTAGTSIMVIRIPVNTSGNPTAPTYGALELDFMTYNTANTTAKMLITSHTSANYNSVQILGDLGGVSAAIGKIKGGLTANGYAIAIGSDVEGALGTVAWNIRIALLSRFFSRNAATVYPKTGWSIEFVADESAIGFTGTTYTSTNVKRSGEQTNFYGTCSTAASTAAKVATVTDYIRKVGNKVTLKFSYTNTATNPTLNINGTGAAYILYMGNYVPPANLQTNGIYDFVWTGSYYELLGASFGLATQSQSGLMSASDKTKLDNAVATNAAATMAAMLTAQSNTNYTTKQVRNIVFWTSGTTPPTTSNGDIVIKTFV